MLCKKCGNEYEECGLCRMGERHQQCVDDRECNKCPQTEQAEASSLNDLLSCPFCGGTDLNKLMSGGRNIAANTYCKNEDCPILCVTMSKRQWNNRAT